MATDLNIYPIDYDGSTPGVGDGPSALDVAVNSLAAEARLTAVRQSDARRKAMRASILVQNADTTIINGLLLFDLDQLETETTPPVVAAKSIGSLAITSVPGDKWRALSYATDIYSEWGTSTSDLSSSYMFGSISSGLSAFHATRTAITHTTFALRSSQYTGAKYPIPSALAQSYGVGTKTKGYWINCMTNAGLTLHSLTVSFQYQSQVMTQLGSQTVANGAYLGGLSSISKGYVLNRYRVYAGERGDIESLDYQTEVYALLGISTSPYSLRATSGNSSKGYVMGGKYFAPSVNQIQKLTFSPEAVSTLGAVLSIARWFSCGFGSSTQGYASGGAIRHGSVYTRLEKLNYSTEAVSMVGETATQKLHRSSASDYYGGIE